MATKRYEDMSPLEQVKADAIREQTKRMDDFRRDNPEDAERIADRIVVPTKEERDALADATSDTQKVEVVEDSSDDKKKGSK